MDDDTRAMEQQFDEGAPILIGRVCGEQDEIGVFIRDGMVELPMWMDVEEGVPTGGEAPTFLSGLTPREARDLGGLLIYAAGRANEMRNHCSDCGHPIKDHAGEDEQDA